MNEIVQVTGRWARLANGDFVTPIPSFSECGYDAAFFDRAIAEFQRDPVAALLRNVHQVIPARKAATPRPGSEPPQTDSGGEPGGSP